MIASPDALIGWIFKTIDLSGLTSPLWRVPLMPSESYPWLLHSIRVQYYSNAEDPSDFDSIQWNLAINPRNINLMDLSDVQDRPTISLTLNPGIHDQTAGTTRPKSFFYPGPTIDYMIRPSEPMTFEMEAYTVLTGNVHVLFLGYFILPESVVRR